MNSQTLILLIQLILIVGAYLVGRYIVPNVPQETIQDATAKVNLIISYADKFVSWAKWFMKDYTGAERMAAVVEQLMNIANRYNLDISEEEIKAIAQKAYDQMQAGIKEAENQKIIAEAAKENAANTTSIVIPKVEQASSGINSGSQITTPQESITLL